MVLKIDLDLLKLVNTYNINASKHITKDALDALNITEKERMKNINKLFLKRK